MVNDIFKDTANNNKRFRLIQKYPENDTAVIIEMDNQYRLPKLSNLSEIEEFMESGIYQLCEQKDPVYSLDGLTEKQAENLNKIWKIICPIVQDEAIRFDWKRRCEAINNIVTEDGCSHSTVQRWLHRYWAGGSTKMALVPEYKKRGGPTKTRAAGNNQIGRPYKYQPQKPHARIGESEKKKIKHIVDITYNKNTKYKMSDAYALFIHNYYWDNEHNALMPLHPTIAQFRYYAKKVLNLRRRIGEKKFDRNYRAITGNSACEADGPGEKYQIDATIADVYLVSRTDRNAVIGRPVLYFVTDVFSHMITGFYVSLEGPSWVDAMMALYYTNMDKKKLCSQFGIDINERDWPCAGLPQILLTDNGELVSEASNQLVSDLGIHMQNTSAWRPDLKAIVEQSFHLINSKTRMLLPGGVQPDYRERGAPDYKLDATLNLFEFNQIIIHYIFKYNSRVLTKNPQNSEDIIQAHIKPIPLELWNWGIRNRSGCLARRNEEEVAYSLLPNDSARITDRGIKYKSLYYICSSFIRENMGSDARINGTWKVQIKHDPRQTRKILLCHDNGQFEVCTRVESYCEDWFEEDFQYKDQMEKAEADSNQNSNLRNEVAFQSKVDDIIKKAQEEKTRANNVVQLPEKSKIRLNRKQELLKQRQKETFLPDKTSNYEDSKPIQQKSSKEKRSAEILQWQKEDDT
jgi:Uncharacterized conserved protein